MRIGLQFPFRFDIDRLHGDLAKVLPHEWSPHYNERDYGGTWRGIALRSATGSSRDLQALPGGGGDFSATGVLERCAYFREVLSAFHCPLKSVRLLGLAPQSFIREHSDHALGYDDGEVRIHIPIRTNPGVEFYVAGERLLLEEGASYFVNVNLPHRVNNRGPSERVHLVIDAEVNDWVRTLVGQGEAEGWHIPRCPLPPGSLDDFRKLVLRDDALQARLRGIQDRRQFTDAVLDLAIESACEVHQGDVDAGFHAAVEDAGGPVRGWTPTRISIEEDEPVAEWLWTGEKRFRAPFFEDDIRECRRLPFAAFFRRTAPLKLAQDLETPAPAGFIFHMSRCGSTLVSRMLSSLARVAMISEAPPLDEILREKKVAWLRWMVAALGRRCAPDETHYFLKLDAWHIHSLPLIRQAFPETPWIFLHRDPLEVAVSQLRSPGLLGAPGMIDPQALGMRPEDAVLGRDEWCVRVLAAILHAASAQRGDPLGMFVDYRQLPQAVWDAVGGHFGMAFSPEERERMRETSLVDAKRPWFSYESDSEGKRAAAGAHLRELVGRWLEPVYREIEETQGRRKG
jgi:hypothetical protein